MRWSGWLRTPMVVPASGLSEPVTKSRGWKLLNLVHTWCRLGELASAQHPPPWRGFTERSCVKPLFQSWAPELPALQIESMLLRGQIFESG